MYYSEAKKIFMDTSEEEYMNADPNDVLDYAEVADHMMMKIKGHREGLTKIIEGFCPDIHFDIGLDYEVELDFWRQQKVLINKVIDDRGIERPAFEDISPEEEMWLMINLIPGDLTISMLEGMGVKGDEAIEIIKAVADSYAIVQLIFMCQNLIEYKEADEVIDIVREAIKNRLSELDAAVVKIDDDTAAMLMLTANTIGDETIKVAVDKAVLRRNVN